MTHTSTEQAEARDLAYWIAHTTDNPTAALIQSLHARVQELEASQAQRVPLSDDAVRHIKALTEIVRMPNAEYVADAHNDAVRYLHGITQEKHHGK